MKSKTLNKTKEMATLPTIEDQYKSFLHWYSMSPDQKIRSSLPTSIPDYLKANNLTSKDLSTFYSKDTFADDIVESTVKWAKTKTSEMIHILYERYKDRKLASDFTAFTDFITKINAKEKSNQTQVNIFNLNDEQYRQIITREANIIHEGTNVVSGTSSQE